MKDVPEKIICEKAAKEFKVFRVFYTSSDEDNNLEITASVNFDKDLEAIYSEILLDPVEGWVFQTRAPLLITDTEKDPRFLVKKHNDFLHLSVLCFPIRSGKKTLGVVTLHRESKKIFGTESIKKIPEFSAWARDIIEKDRLNRENLRSRSSIQFIAALAEEIECAQTTDQLVKNVRKIFYDHINTEKTEVVIFKDKKQFGNLPRDLRKILSTGEMNVIQKKQSTRIIVPLKTDDRIRGYLELEGDDLGNYLDVLPASKLMISSRLENMINQDEIREKRQLAEAFEKISDYKIQDKLTTASTLSRILDRVMEIIIKLIGVERVNVMLYEPESGILRVQAYWGIDEKPFGREILNLGEGVAGHALATGKYYQKQQQGDEVFVDSPTGQEEIKSLLAYPMIVEGRKIGVINIGSIYADRIFSENEIRTVAMIASRAALIIENAKLHQRCKDLIEESDLNRKNLEKIREDLNYRSRGLTVANRRAKEAISHLDRLENIIFTLERSCASIAKGENQEKILKTFMDNLLEIFDLPPKFAAVVLLNESTGKGMIKAHRGKVSKYRRLLEVKPSDAPDLIQDTLFKQGNPLMIHQVKNSRVFSSTPLTMGLNSLYIFPFKSLEHTFGALVIGSGREKFISNEIGAIVSIIANTLAAKLSSIRNYDEIKKRSEKLSRLNQIWDEITIPSNLQEHLDGILRTSCKLLEHEFGLLLIYDDQQKLRLKARYRDRENFVKYLENPEVRGIIEQVINRNKIYYSSTDYEQLLKRYSMLERTGIKSLVILPLQSRGKKRGALLVGDEKPKLHTKLNRDFYKLLTRQLSLAVDNALLFSRIILEKERFESIIESMDEGLVTINWERNITNFNPKAEKITGYSAKEAVSKPCYKIFSCRPSVNQESCIDICPLVDMLKMNKDGARGMKIEGKFLTSDGQQRDMDATLSLLSHSGNPVGGVLVFKDVTDEKAHQARRSDYLAAISHDIFTPLTAIKGYASALLLHREKFDIQTQYEFIKTINSEIDRITRLLHNLMSLSRMETDKLQIHKIPLDLNKRVEKIVDLYSYSTRIHNIIVDPGVKNAPKVYADSDQVEQILNNLVSNAIKYSPGGGDIIISAEEKDGFVEVSVRDHGIGLDPSETDIIFKRYHRTIKDASRSVSGMGLGLYITKALVELQGGKIWAQSCPDEGSKFTFTLPIFSEDILDQEDE